MSTSAEKFSNALQEMKREYLDPSHNWPWIVGFSGGKDSTLILQLQFEMMLSLAPSQRTRDVIVLSNDTLVESPILMAHLRQTLLAVQNGAEALSLPVKTVTTQPEIDQTFWVNLIGRGYPSPTKQFRWCTDRMKIQPTSEYILREVSEFGEVIILLGVRSDESATRAGNVAKHTVEGERLHPHTELKGCWVYRPIVDFTTEEVWQILLQRPAPWGGSHRDLVTLYRNANGGECPLVIDQSQAPSCGTGSSRFGCWTCTVVKKDRSLEGLIDNGAENLEPLLDFRDWLVSIRDHRDYRQSERRSGATGAGPFTVEARKKILTRLLRTQADLGEQLISEAEIARIHEIWVEDAVLQGERFVEKYLQIAVKYGE
jgi:DNA sulfur modification protein DndC